METTTTTTYNSQMASVSYAGHGKKTVSQKTKATAHQQRAARYFMIGKLQFGYHGVLGIVTMVLTLSAMLSLNPYHALFLQIFIHLIARDGYHMIDQSPVCTDIFNGGVKVDHKPAFRLTVDVCHYLTVRIITKCLTDTGVAPAEYADYIFWAFFPFQFWRWWRLTPTQIYSVKHIMTNRNPWLLLMPMGFGITADMIQMFTGQGDEVSLYKMLQIQMFCLLFSFLFTLAFRKYLPVPFLYVSALSTIWSIDYNLALILFRDFKNFLLA